MRLVVALLAVIMIAGTEVSALLQCYQSVNGLVNGTMLNQNMMKVTCTYTGTKYCIKEVGTLPQANANGTFRGCAELALNGIQLDQCNVRKLFI
jgi:hypothetical protein